MSATYDAPSVDFYFDVQCPYAYIASRRVESVVKSTGTVVNWTPVLLGGLYDLTNAEQGKAGSASDVMPVTKKALVSLDFNREVNRYGIPLNFHPQHPLRSVDAGRLLCAFPPEHRAVLAHALYRAYWVDNDNISSREILLRIARSLQLRSPLLFALDESIFSNETFAQQLRTNTQTAFGNGAFGVPSFWIPARNRLFFGQDRLHLLEAALLSIKLHKPLGEIHRLEKIMPRCVRTPTQDRQRTLTFWFDFSSPWSYLGWSQLERISRNVGPGLEIILKPFLLGALFRDIGTPMLPGRAQNPTKQAYAAQDLANWTAYWNAVNSQQSPSIEPIDTTWPDIFPIRSVTALRIAILEPKTVPAIYRAAWKANKNISGPKILSQTLSLAGFNGDALLAAVTTGPRADLIKATLKRNNDEALKLGICGAPSYQVGEHLVWGQDRVNVVEDLIFGWKPESSPIASSAYSQSDSHL